MKAAALLRAAGARSGVSFRLVHTGQHYDARMSTLFFQELELPEPDVYLGVGSASHAVQTARVLETFDLELDCHRTDVVVVVGDVNSTLACALAAGKRGIPVAHVEAGLRSGDRRMPEEINRILTDQLSDFLFTTERAAVDNLLREGIPRERVYFVGNVMIDTLLRHRDRARRSDVIDRLGLTARGYGLCTIHRPVNVDTFEQADNTVRAIEAVATRVPIVFPAHPRTYGALAGFGLLERLTGSGAVQVIEPLGYLDFLALMDQARVVFTDSGGIQEETTVLGVQCLTFRTSTERPVTLTEGTNRLVGPDPEQAAAAVDEVLKAGRPATRAPELWDGCAGERILDVLLTGAAQASVSDTTAAATTRPVLAP
jgi:UDP-N-acetylglucosamine 2-epimerase (non-hydrolysing)